MVPLQFDQIASRAETGIPKLARRTSFAGVCCP